MELINYRCFQFHRFNCESAERDLTPMQIFKFINVIALEDSIPLRYDRSYYYV
jgi:hypothetical protein